MFSLVIDRLLQLAGWDRCGVCRRYTMDWRGYSDDVSLCPECFDILTEAEQLVEDDK